ncbi:MAG TPA: hypothetical protein VJY85_08755 [Candidatus Limnocylindria bacterium]|nr:hypothetical protein [Candidatus Limnocylindria bacterium]
MTPITVSCQPEGAGFICAVTVGDDPAATHHQVDVEAADLERLHPGAADPEALVRAAFDFLLKREPRESILRRFDLPVIGRYFPGWELEVARRLSAD